MDLTAETAAVVALLRAARHPPSVYAELVEEHGSALAVLEHDGGVNPPRPGLFDNETMQALLDTAMRDLGRWRQQGMQALTVLDARYPENLRTVHDRPPLIFVAGELHPRHRHSVAVVGSRRASVAGLAEARAVAEHLVETGYTVASGLATGIDTAAHTAALSADGHTLAVIGNGLNHCYPPHNARLQARIAHQEAVISQFWPDATPNRQSFPMRNAVMSGLTLGTVVVEATHTSGARTQARQALNHGRPVFLMGSLLAQPWARELADKPGVHVTGAPQEITRTLARLNAEAPLVA